MALPVFPKAIDLEAIAVKAHRSVEVLGGDHEEIEALDGELADKTFSCGGVCAIESAGGRRSQGRRSLATCLVDDWA